MGVGMEWAESIFRRRGMKSTALAKKCNFLPLQFLRNKRKTMQYSPCHPRNRNKEKEPRKSHKHKQRQRQKNVIEKVKRGSRKGAKTKSRRKNRWCQDVNQGKFSAFSAIHTTVLSLSVLNIQCAFHKLCDRSRIPFLPHKKVSKLFPPIPAKKVRYCSRDLLFFYQFTTFHTPSQRNKKHEGRIFEIPLID